MERHRLVERLRNKEARVAVVGLGRTGLPLAVVLAEAGFHVTGVEREECKVRRLREGESYVQDVPSSRLQLLVDEGRLAVTTETEALARCDAVSICVPTPLTATGEPDLSCLIEACEAIAPHVHAGMVVVLESTVYPGATAEVVLPLLAGRNPELQAGESFFLAFSPERIDPGRTDWTLRTTPKVVGGVTPACLEVAMAYYSKAVETLVPVSSAAAAEMTKLVENTFRAVNVGLANEILLMCEALDLDAREVIRAAGTKPFGFMPFTPGPGLGGPCIPVAPRYLAWKLERQGYRPRFIELAGEINGSMPAYWVGKVEDALSETGIRLEGAKILVLGVAYKRDSNDVRESPALEIIRLLRERGAEVAYHDPFVPALRLDGMQMVAVCDLGAAVADSDCVVVATNHSVYDGCALGAARATVNTRLGEG